MSRFLGCLVPGLVLGTGFLVRPEPVTAQMALGSGVRFNARLGTWGSAIPTGFWITAVQPYSPATYAGLVPGDVVVRVNDRLITNEMSLEQALRTAGGRARLLVRHTPSGQLRYTWINLWR
ncbi:MAG TPA: PDZ domain-containing protein [Gemmatales bacterium]|nr:PDZ domain-containing protein [Gemmatales bacterium]